MYKRLVGEYIKDELKKGETIDQIRKRLIKTGYDKKDVDEVLRTFEYKEADLKNKGNRLAIKRMRVHVLLVIILLVSVINAAFFFYYFSNHNYILVRETPTGFITTTATEEELQNLEQNINRTNSSLEGLSKIT